MAVFLHEPRYRLGCVAFFTEPAWGRRVMIVGVAISGIGILGAGLAHFFDETGSGSVQALFLIAAAWILIQGFMRVMCSGAMWIFTQVFDWISDGIPSAASTIYCLKRGYWIVTEIFLSTALLSTLFAAAIIPSGAWSLTNNNGEQSRAPDHSHGLSF